MEVILEMTGFWVPRIIYMFPSVSYFFFISKWENAASVLYGGKITVKRFFKRFELLKSHDHFNSGFILLIKFKHN